MNQDNLRQQVKHLKANGISYKKVAESIGVNQSSFYSWLAGKYEFKESVAMRLQDWIREELLQRTPRGKKNKTVRNLINLLQEYSFEEDEIMRPLPQYDSNVRYYITNYGNLFSLCGNEWVKKVPQYDKDGYLYVDIYCNGERTRKRIHTLVVEAFMPTEDLSDKVIHHLDQQKDNDELSNLVPLTREEHQRIHKYLQKWRNTDADKGDLDIQQLEDNKS